MREFVWSFGFDYFYYHNEWFLTELPLISRFIFMTAVFNLFIWLTETIGGIMILLFSYWNTCMEKYQKILICWLDLLGTTQNLRVPLLVGMNRETRLRKIFRWLSQTRLWPEASRAKLRRFCRSTLRLISKCLYTM